MKRSRSSGMMWKNLVEFILVVFMTSSVLASTPQIDVVLYSPSVKEFAELGTVVAHASVTGDDGHGVVCDLTNNNFRLVAMTKSEYKVMLDENLDYEHSPTHEVTVTCIDMGQPPQTATSTFTIHVQDVNDNRPVFVMDSNQFTVVENSPIGQVVTQVQATDADDGVNGRVRYNLQDSSNSFGIDPSSGKITTRRVLDREVAEVYEIQVTAMDAGSPSLSTTATLTITVTDVNDNGPVFHINDTYIFIPENNPIGQIVTRLFAVDPDKGDNGKVTYSLVQNPGNIFTLDPVTGDIIALKTLDREVQTVYELVVRADDGGFPPLSSMVSVQIHVKDVNDNAPVFTRRSYECSIAENNNIGQSVVRIQASDNDSGRNSAIRYSLSENPDQIFQIDEDSGIIRAQRVLDREEVDLYTLVVVAADEGTSPLSSKSMVTVHVTDVNDNFPVFNASTYHATISPNSSVSQIYASDRDVGENGQVTYSLATDSDMFQIDPLTGVITLLKTPSRGNDVTYELLVIAKDNGDFSMSSSATVYIEVKSITDNVDVSVYTNHTSDYLVSIDENNYVGQEITQISNFYDGFANGSNVTYSLAKNPDEMFEIDSQSGILRAARIFDREKSAEYFVVVEVQDAESLGNTSSITVIVKVGDVNDNTPVFTSSIYQSSIVENMPGGYRFAQVTAHDADDGENANVTYSLVYNPDDKFQINPISGVIETAMVLDREATPKFNLLVKASDGGNPSRFSVTRVIVLVKDVNDQAPIFTTSTYESTVTAESTFIGQVVTQVQAIDEDEGDNSNIFYTLGTDSVSNFCIESVTGIITIEMMLNIDMASLYRFEVIATDSGTPPLSSTATVVINVRDTDEGY